MSVLISVCGAVRHLERCASQWLDWTAAVSLGMSNSVFMTDVCSDECWQLGLL